MPSSTFLRLNQKKRVRFLEEAYIEFSVNTFQGASITNLVKTLGIAKGSVYQYFEDKDDLYQFLVEEAMRHVNELLDKTCPYDGDEFYSWYTRVLIVQVKYYLSFPAHAVLLKNVNTGVVNIDRVLKEAMAKSLLSRLKRALPADQYDSEINNSILISAPLQVFDLLTRKLNLARVISSKDPIFLDSKELMDICNHWVNKLKNGL